MREKLVVPHGARLTELRTQQGWSQKRVAMVADCSLRQVQKIEASERVQRAYLVAVARVFGVSERTLTARANDTAFSIDGTPSPTIAEHLRHLGQRARQLLAPSALGSAATLLYRTRTLGDSNRLKAEDHETLKHERGKEKDRPPRIRRDLTDERLLEQVLSSDFGRAVCIVGPAGMGKSTLLLHFAAELASKVLERRSAIQLVPVVIELRSWDPSRHRTIDDLVRAFAPSIKSRLLRHLVAHGHLALLLDGLDEVQPDPKRQEFLRRLSEWVTGNPAMIVLTTRPWTLYQAELGSLPLRYLALHEFTNRDVTEYVRVSCDVQHGRRLLDRVNTSLALNRLVRCPLLLRLLCQVSSDSIPDTLSNEGEIIELFLRELLRRRGIENPERCLEALAYVAHQMHVEVLSTQWRSTTQRRLHGLITAGLRNARKRGFAGGGSEEGLVQSLMAASGVFAVAGAVDCRFAEATFQEFLVGRWIASLEPFQVRELFGAHIWQPLWQRALLFAMSMMWRENPLLAGQLAAWCRAEIELGRDDIYGTLTALCAQMVSCAAESSDMIEATATYCARRLASILSRSEDRGSATQEETAILALASIGSITPSVVHRLIQEHLREKKSVLQLFQNRAWVARVAGRTDPDAAYEELVSALGTGGELAEAAIDALGKCEASDPTDLLVDRYLEHPFSVLSIHTDVARACLRALEQQCTRPDRREQVGSALERRLDSADEQTATACIQAIGRLQIEGAVPSLLRRLGNGRIAASICDALGEIGNPAAVEALLELVLRCNYPDCSDAWHNAADALKRMHVPGITDQVLARQGSVDRGDFYMAIATLGGRNETHLLIDGLDREKGEGRAGPVCGLAMLRDPQTVGLLCDLACDPDEDMLITWAAFQGLASIGAAFPPCRLSVARASLCGLKHADSMVREAAAMALCVSEVRAEWLVGPLFEASSDTDTEVAGHAIAALGHTRSLTAVDPLIKLMASVDDSLKPRIPTALGQIGGRSAVTAITTMMSHEIADVRRQAVLAIGQAQCDLPLDQLPRVLSDDAPEVRSAVADVLTKRDATRAVCYLSQLLCDPDRYVRQAAADSLTRMSSAECIPPLMAKGFSREGATLMANLGLTWREGAMFRLAGLRLDPQNCPQ